MILLVFLLYLFVQANDIDLSIQVATEAPFAPVTFLSEASEVIYSLSQTAFWHYIEYIHQQELWKLTEKEQYEATESFVKTISGHKFDLAKLKAEISHHTYAPFIETQHQLADQAWISYLQRINSSNITPQATTFAVVFPPNSNIDSNTTTNKLDLERPLPHEFLSNKNGIIFLSLEELLDHLKTYSRDSNYSSTPHKTIQMLPSILDSDHILYGMDRTKSNLFPIVHLYSSLNDPHCFKWLDSLQSKQKARRSSGLPFTIVFRHNRFSDPHFDNTTKSNMLTVGFGAEIAIRDTEYVFGDKDGSVHNKTDLTRKISKFGSTQDFEEEGTINYLQPPHLQAFPILGVDLQKIASLHPSLATTLYGTPLPQDDSSSAPSSYTQPIHFVEGSYLHLLRIALQQKALTTKVPLVRLKDICIKAASFVSGTTHVDELLQSLSENFHSRFPNNNFNDTILINDSNFSREDALERLQLVGEAFPYLLPSLQHLRISERDRMMNTEILRDVPSTSAQLLINNRPVDVRTILSTGPWSLNAAVEQEIAHASEFTRLGLSGDVAEVIASADLFQPEYSEVYRQQSAAFLPNEPTEEIEMFNSGAQMFSLSTVRVAMMPPNETLYLNNIETDPRFRRWTPDINLILQYAGGGIVPIRRNMFLLIAALDF